MLNIFLLVFVDGDLQQAVLLSLLIEFLLELELMIEGEQTEELDEPDETPDLYHAVEYRLGLGHSHSHLLVEVQEDQKGGLRRGR